MQAADVPETEEQLESQLDFDLEEILHISAKQGTGLEKLFAEIIERIEPPSLEKLNPDEGNKLDAEAVKCFLFGARYI